MKKKIFISLFLSLFLLTGIQKVNAQIGRSDWYGNPVLGMDNPYYAIGLTILSNIVQPVRVPDRIARDESQTLEWLSKRMWFIPQWQIRTNIIQKMEFDAGEATIRPGTWGWKGADWVFRNYSIGYRFGYLPRVSHIGFEVEADYVQDGYKVKMPWADKKESMIKRMIAATALARIRFMDYGKWAINPIFEVGGSYHYALHYHDGLVNDKDAVNNGFTGIVGIGFTSTDTHITFNFRYEQTFYDFHNDDYVYQGNKIFSGAKSKFGRLSGGVSIVL